MEKENQKLLFDNGHSEHVEKPAHTISVYL